jgi:hypothetical protein
VVESRIVIPVVVGSIPISHPKYFFPLHCLWLSTLWYMTVPSLRHSGMSLTDLEAEIEIVTQKLVELKPELERAL